ncbi:bifunctional 2-polyprenyl-6-hydroxyphenol methylase/3-demethylubiquinol 3-O-methyltransferase UbiG [Aliidiomarina maris]|uniref:Ubiquinone biosynthesis O-methyltransferase n=1 Tax=Aliidiomarina maris TaxID=531312 RepID=A0A327WZB1_9GAMM|nr:bifunctional 2-polyprenyl-6-hydroxyphenol methylase/3-demethylubiquinol 3-O-methyltransferase UbiG [Aliidiomarina maris]MBA3988960.1 bifunctional 3-demethylubiquinol 3-O-methyltransferase/2-polyprenyl-6-hydroxyphenol methylase [Idiomarina sp.]MCL5050395.1 bifunctional 2-polyprenyl-6-hydroxyphenol methylase/3-demethylubiquinol 3-O-methyltransferase UbiG [Bacillota bacterium]RAJ98849.1 3-demethylubiquinone-9 3-methyltransferase [Aliidiomarina maris]RUO24996.1 bifunctional 3-demethylubiquinol 3
MSQNVDAQEIDKFSAVASRWWDPEGEFKPLHLINPLRVNYIETHSDGLFGKRVLDVGCGGGLLSEAMAKLGAQVSAIDMSAEALDVARLHALDAGVQVDYQQSTAEQFAEQHAGEFDVVTCLEMLEHVPDPEAVIAACARLVKPGGELFFSTLNRNLKARLLGVIAAEYILRWVPKGTHDHHKFIKPSELLDMAERHGVHAHDMTGLHYNPLSREFFLSNRNVDVNYIVHCRSEA